jgi:hypothetical protein
MFKNSIGAECKSLYTSPLAEEIVVSFEENLLGDSGKPAELRGWQTGGVGGSGYGSGDGEDIMGDTYGGNDGL